MPFFMHVDILYVNYFPYFLSYKNVWDVYGYFGHHYVDRGFAYYPPLVYYLIGFSQWAVKPLSAGFQPFIEHVHSLMYSSLLYSTEDLFSGFSLNSIRRFSFFMKLPYLVADIVSACLIYKIQDSHPKQEKTLFLWLFFPVSLFSSYIFGQYRIFSATFMWAMLYFVKRDKLFWSGIMLGFLCLMDNFPFYLFFPTWLILAKTRSERWLFLIATGIPLAAVLLPLVITSRGLVLYAYTSHIIQKAFFQSITLSFFTNLVAVSSKLLLLFIYFTGLYLLVRHKDKVLNFTRPDRIKMFVYANLCYMMALYGTSGIMIHYFMWALPLFILIIIEKEPWPAVFSWIFIFCLFIFNLDSRGMNSGLMIPAFGAKWAVSTPSIHEVMARYLPWGIVVSLARVVFSTFCFFFIWRIYKIRIKPLIA